VKLCSNRLGRVSEGYSPARFIMCSEGRGERQVGPGPLRHFACRAEERHTSPVVQAPNPPNVRVLQKVGQSESGSGPALRALQLLQGSWFADDHACNGGGDHGSHLELGGTHQCPVLLSYSYGSFSRPSSTSHRLGAAGMAPSSSGTHTASSSTISSTPWMVCQEPLRIWRRHLHAEAPLPAGAVSRPSPCAPRTAPALRRCAGSASP
jgi:hypothetical protein